LEESTNTLKFASRTKKVVTKAQTNEMVEEKALIQLYRGEITDLKAKLIDMNQMLQETRIEDQNLLVMEKQKV